MGEYFVRRRFLFGSTAFITQMMLFRRASAQALSRETVPTIDSLRVKVLMDSSHDIFLRAPTPKGLRVQRTSGLADYRQTLHNQWGLSLALESGAGAETRRVLLDFGYQPETLLANMEMLNVDPSTFDAIVLSHGHYDHFGGLVGFLDKHRAKMKSDLTLYVGGEDNFCERKRPTGKPGHFSDFGYLDREEVAAKKVNIVSCEKPTVVADHAFTTGTIARTGFERVLPNTRVVYGKRGGIGCDAAAFQGKETGQPLPDEHVHEHATCFNLRDRGLVVVTSCGHAGIINTVRQAMTTSGIDKLHALIGGFHLAIADEQYLTQAVAELKSLNPDLVIPMHCSGVNFLQAMRDQMPDRLALSTTGTTFELGV